MDYFWKPLSWGLENLLSALSYFPNIAKFLQAFVPEQCKGCLGHKTQISEGGTKCHLRLFGFCFVLSIS